MSHQPQIIQQALHSKYNFKTFRPHLTEEEQYLFDYVYTDKKDPNQYHPSFFDNAKFMIALKPLMAGRFCLCGVAGCRCKESLFCSRCSYAKAMSKMKTYLKNFRHGNFYFLTISFQQDVPFHEFHETFFLYWKVIHILLSELRKMGWIQGALVSDEVTVSRFLPLHLLPHCHAIIDAEEFDVEMIKFLTERVQLTTLLPATVRYRKINTVSDFKGGIGYMYKPMTFSDQYDTAYEANIEHGFGRINQLNHEVVDVLEGIRCVLTEEQCRRGCAIGTFHHQAKNSLFIPKSYRIANDAKIFKYVKSVKCNTYDFVEEDFE